MKFILNKDELTIENEECLNSGSVKYYEAEVEHDEEWNGLTIEAVIVRKEGGAIQDIGTGIAVINNKIYIDKDLSGSYAIGFRGYTIKNEVKTYQISTNLKGLFFNKGAGEIEVSNSEQIPTPTEWEQYLSQVTEFINNANETIDEAEELIEELEEAKTAEAERKENEEVRQQAEEDREEAEASREEAENGRNTAEGQRQENESTRQNNEQTRQGNENVREENEEDREDAEAIRQQNEEARKNAENARKTAETNRANAETSRATAETGRVNAETARATNENTRNSNETTRQTNETTRQAQEGARQESETARNTAETNRASSETDRDTAETNRASAETTRVSNENTRISNEEVRQGKINKVASMLKDVTQTGTTIHTTDSADWYGDLNPEGFSRQNTRSGKNKFNKNSTGRLNKVATTVLDTGVKVVIAQTGSYCSVSYAIIDIREHYGSTVRIKTTMSASANNVAKLAYGFCNSVAENMGNQTTSSTGELEVVLPNSVTEGREYLGLILYANYKGTSAVDDYAEFKDLIVTIDNADMTYEEYGVSPSPDYPSEIRNLESNGNLANEDTIFGQYFDKDEDGFYVATSLNIYNKYKESTGGFPITFKANTQYTFSCDIKAETSTVNYSYNFTFKYSDNTTSSYGGYGTALKHISLTSTAGKTISSFSFGYNSGSTLHIKNFQVTEGAEEKPYAFYDSLRFKQFGKNYALNDDPENPDINYYGGSGSSAVQYSTTEKGYYTTSNRSRIIKLGKSGDFTFSLDIKLRSEGTSTNVGILYHYNTKTGAESSIGYISTVTSLTSNYARYTKTFTNSENYDAIRIVFYNHLFWKNIQVEEGTATDYEPYKEHNIDFPLNGQKMYEGSTLQDEGITHIRKKIVFDGTENWSMYNDTPGKYYCTTKHFGRETGYENPSTFKCTHFTPAIGTATTNGISSTKFATYINMDTTTISDLSSFKTWLSNNNVLVEYLSAEPEIISYTEAQQEAYNELQNLETYQYVNNIELIANEETNMTFNYKKDIQMQINNIDSRLTLLE